ncbi:hypothetical protein EYF80_035125 [Liparis tanakae]|uniref:Uncharacterized protein n=1 Tax=Liparis tanakae TaxID=230148 RepID=A0A4Z2GPF1_9TELE|nr:hypothetical protein EYF80_035125 [Liparis tanakae]
MLLKEGRVQEDPDTMEDLTYWLKTRSQGLKGQHWEASISLCYCTGPVRRQHSSDPRLTTPTNVLTNTCQTAADPGGPASPAPREAVIKERSRTAAVHAELLARLQHTPPMSSD